MTHRTLTDEQETLAALYALGSLSPEEARAFERHLAEDGCELCRGHVEAMGAVCSDLALAPSRRTPSPAVRTRVLAEAARAHAKVTPAFAFTFAGDGDWIEIQPGVSTKSLLPPQRGAASKSYLIRLEPGAVIPGHGHECFEHCYVISGSGVVHGRRVQAGDYHYAPRGSVHEPIRSDEGALLLIVEAL